MPPPRPVHRALQRITPPRFFYGWYIALAGAANNFLILGIVFLGFGVLFEPIRNELGWSMTAITAGVSLRSFQQGFLSPVTGTLVDRFGPKAMTLAGVTILAAGLLMFSQARTLPVYYGASLVIALGQSLGGTLAYSLALMNWFNRKRGRATGILFAGNAAGFFVVPVMAALVSALGWRWAVASAGAAIFVTGIPLALVLRLRPEPYGYLPDGDPPGAVLGNGLGTAMPRSDPGLTVAQTVRTRSFYLLALANAASVSVWGTIITLQVPHLRNEGFSLAAVGLIVAAFGGVQAPLRVLAGWLGDTLSRRWMFILGHLVMAIGIAIFTSLNPSRLWLLPMLYLTLSVGQAAWVVGHQTVVADHFGTKRYASIQGLLQAINMPTSLAAPVFAAWMFDRTGSYQAVFMAYAALLATGALWAFLMPKPPWDAGLSATAAVEQVADAAEAG